MKKAAAAKGLRLYAIKAQTGYANLNLNIFDDLAKLGNGSSFWMDYGNNSYDTSAGKQVITQVLVDAINSQFKDRIQPFVDIIWEAVVRPRARTPCPLGPDRPPPQPAPRPRRPRRCPPPTPDPRRPNRLTPRQGEDRDAADVWFCGHRPHLLIAGDRIESSASGGRTDIWDSGERFRGVAQFGLERLVRDQEVAGSNPVTPTL